MSAWTEEQAAQRMQQVDPGWNEARVERALQGLHRKARRNALLRGGAIAAVALSAAAAFAVFQMAPQPAEDVAVVVPQPPAAASAERVELSDGSTIDKVSDADVVVSEVSRDKVSVQLRKGRVAVEVVPRPEREFIVDAGDFKALVLGTGFEVDRREGGVFVAVRHGHVRVLSREGDALADLHDGESRLFTRETALAPEVPSGPVAEERPGEEATVAARPQPKKGSDWRPVARKGSYDEAYDLIQKAGRGAVNDSIEDLLLAADAARLSGHPSQALPYLDKIVGKHGGDGRAAMAAFTRGRILLNLGRLPDAGSSFEKALTLGASGSLAENALARAVEAYGRAGDARSKSLAQRYVARYPEGRWLAPVRKHGGLAGD